MNTQDAIKKLVDLLGGQTKAAAALGVKQPTVFGWLNGKHGMRAGVAIRAERLVDGRVTAADLCPELSQPDGPKAA